MHVRHSRSWFLVALSLAAVPFLSCATGSLPARAEAASAAGKYRIKVLDQVDASDFPTIKLSFQIVNEHGEPARDLPDEEITILEDGKVVHRFRPRGLKSEPMVVMVGMDTSGSMDRPAGRPKIEEAKHAASQFFGRLNEATPCGLVLFHHEPYEIRPPAKDRRPPLALVSGCKPEGGTAYLDATSVAIKELAAANLPGQRVVVVMTDGRDVNSKRSLAEVISEAKAQRARVYTIGLGAPGRNEPVRTVLVLDRSGSMRGDKIEHLRSAATRFVNLLPPELADTTLIAFSDTVPRAEPFTNHKDALREAIKGLVPQGRTRLFDATYDAVELLNAARDLDGQNVRRAVIVFTDGKDTGSHRREQDIIERAAKDGIKVFTLGLGQENEINKKALEDIALNTGGRFYHVRDAGELTKIFEHLSIELHDDGIDERSLRELARQTGGEYFHVQDADNLALQFERVATQLENTYAVRFRSRRAIHDGTSRGIEIRFGELAVGTTGYLTHGLIAPRSHHLLYLGLLAVLLALLAAPALVRRLVRGAGAG